MVDNHNEETDAGVVEDSLTDEQLEETAGGSTPNKRTPNSVGFSAVKQTVDFTEVVDDEFRRR